jgi:hypothetical protein
MVGLDDEVQRVLALDDRFALELQTVPAKIGTAQMVQERRPEIRILGRARFGPMLMSDDEEGQR